MKWNIKVFNEIPSIKEIFEEKQQVKVQKKKRYEKRWRFYR